MLSTRTVFSLAQYLALQERNFASALLMKHGLHGLSFQIATQTISEIIDALQSCGEDQLTALLDEIARTRGDLRSRVNPKYRYDQRFNDLELCLQLDGYRLDNGGLTFLDTSVIGAPPLNDDLKLELDASGLPNIENIIQKLDDSASSFASSNPNFNACLNDARVALQALATAISEARLAVHPGTFDSTKWGSVINYLRISNFITVEEERGLSGVFGFVSPGSHRPLGLSDQEMARLGRSLITGICWFLIKRYRAGA
jgi:hypothetical protein